MCTGNTSNNNTFNGWSGTGNIWFHHLPKNILQWQRQEIYRSATCWKIAKWHGFYPAFFFNKSFNIKVLRLNKWMCLIFIHPPPPQFSVTLSQRLNLPIQYGSLYSYMYLILVTHVKCGSLSDETPQKAIFCHTCDMMIKIPHCLKAIIKELRANCCCPSQAIKSSP